ncbi:virulence-associated E family protein [Limosilactobacillus antri]|uniref:virulence-associated E family protein n=1 Tax=Limosilactobacillus antri TaxID=227943 RepID=UPI001F55CCDC|nr:virulence-associated E family protein [Limosilactobacillus antri]
MTELLLIKNDKDKKDEFTLDTAKPMRIAHGDAISVVLKLIKEKSSDELIATGNKVTYGGLDFMDVNPRDIQRDFLILDFLLKDGTNFDYVVKKITHSFYVWNSEGHPDVEWLLLEQKTRNKARNRYFLLLNTEETVKLDAYKFGRSLYRRELLSPEFDDVGYYTTDHHFVAEDSLFPMTMLANYHHHKSDGKAYNRNWQRSMDVDNKAVKEAAKRDKAVRQAAYSQLAKANAIQLDKDGNPMAIDVNTIDYMIEKTTGDDDSPLLGENTLDKRVVFLKDFKYSYQLGDLKKKRVISFTNGKHLEDTDFAKFKALIEAKYHCTPDKDKLLRDAISLIASDNKFNPFLNYINSLKWDGQKRLANLFIDYLGAPKNDLNRWAAECMLVSVIALNSKTNASSQLCWDLIGSQGVGKTLILKKLFMSVYGDPESKDGWNRATRRWYTDQIRSFDNKDDINAMIGHLCVNDDELEVRKNKRTSTAQAKKMASVDEMSIRKAYKVEVSDYKRTWIWAATSNRTYNIYTSRHGNRKFLPIRVRNSKVKKSVADDLTPEIVDQLWAEAKSLYDSLGDKVGDFMRLNADRQAAAEKVQSDLTYIDSATIDIESYVVDRYLDAKRLGNEYKITSEELSNAITDQIPNEAKKIQAIMCDNLGFVQTRISQAGQRKSGYAEGIDTYEAVMREKSVLDNAERRSKRAAQKATEMYRKDHPDSNDVTLHSHVTRTPQPTSDEINKLLETDNALFNKGDEDAE